MIRKILLLSLTIALIDILGVGCVCSHLKDYPRHCKGNFRQAKFDAMVNGIVLPKDSVTSIDFSKLQLNCILVGEIFNCVKTADYNGLFIQTAHACKPAILNLTTIIDSVKSINVYTLNNYNANYAAGANINNIIRHSFVTNNNAALTNLTSTELRTAINNNLVDKQDFWGMSNQSNLLEKPSASGVAVQLAIYCTLTNNTILTDTTSTFNITF